MSTHTPSFGAGTRATIPELIGEFTFKLGNAKLFKRDKEIDGANVVDAIYGVSYALTVIEADDPEAVGLTIPNQFYLHSEAALPMVKQFLMAANGYENDTDGEDLWNESEYAADELWEVNLEEGSMGDGWKNLSGGTVSAKCDIKIKDGRKNQQFSWKVPV